MERDQLLAAIKTTLNKIKVNDLTKIAAENNFSIEELIELTFHNNEQIAFRSAWILENIYTKHQDRFLPHTAYFLQKYPLQNNLSCRRHYTKILALMSHKRAKPTLQEILHQQDTQQLAEKTFEWLIDEKVPVAIKSFCLNILANLTPKHSWIKDELLQTIDYLVDKESIGFFSKAKKIIQQLK